MKKVYDLKDIDLKKVFDVCIACPQPIKTLQNVLQLIINKVTSIDAILKTIGSASSTTGTTDVLLASCFLPRTNAEGDPISKLPHADYTKLIATLVCDLKSGFNGLSIRTENNEKYIEQLKLKFDGLSTEPKISPSECIASSNIAIPLSEAVSKLDTEFCKIAKVIGTAPSLVAGINKQSSDLKNYTQLGSSSTMSTLTGWKLSPATVGDTLSNMWLTILDMRGAVKAIQDNCCKINCDSIVIDFSIKLNDERTEAKLYFASKSKIPVGFRDCDPNGNILTITDSAGGSTQVRVKIASLATYALVSGVMTEPVVPILLGDTSLDNHLDYTFDMEACMTNGELTCQKCITKLVTYKDTCSYCEISVTAGANVSGELVIIYND